MSLQMLPELALKVRMKLQTPAESQQKVLMTQRKQLELHWLHLEQKKESQEQAGSSPQA